MDVKTCFDKRLLRNIPVDLEKVNSSFRISESKLVRAKELFSKGFFEEAVVSAYTSMFHTARALLYKEGIQEKSHYAVYVYLKEKMSKKISVSLIESFFYYQKERHAALYGHEKSVSEEDVLSCIDDSERFINEIRRVI